MIALDTSFIVAYYNIEDENHNKALKIMTDLIKNDQIVYISDYIYDECATVLLTRLKDIKKTVEICNKLREIEILRIDENLFNDTWELFKNQVKTKLSFTDCSTIVLVKSKGLKDIVTLDQEFNKIKDINVLG